MKLELGEPIPKEQRKTLEQVIEERQSEREEKMRMIAEALSVRHKEGKEGLRDHLEGLSQEREKA
ncbi:MAG: hypothetical protein ACKVZH_00980 [Blastocatellia bacterium]